jgi:hypothetical protein
MDLFDEMRQASAKKDAEQMPPPPPKRKREEEEEVSSVKKNKVDPQHTAVSKKIEELGLKPASYYNNLTKTEGIMRRKLKMVDYYIDRQSRQGDEQMTLVLPEMLLDDNIRAALVIQDFEIDEKKVEADCGCGEVPCEGPEAGCVPAGYSITWKNAIVE